MNKLQSLNIFYVSDESETSSFIDKSEISSVSSTASSFTKQHEEYKQQPNTKITKTSKFEEIEEPLKKKKTESTLMLANVKQIVSYVQSNNCASNEEDLGSSIRENSSDLEASQDCHDSKIEDQRYVPNLLSAYSFKV